MLNVTKWFKDGFIFPEGGENFVEALINHFTSNEEIIKSAGTSVTFKNGARMFIRFGSKVAKEAADVTEK